MLTITLPSIAVQKVENGWVVEWTRLLSDEERKGGERTRRVAAVATDDTQLVALIQAASAQVADV